ncbi:hypothetical protein [Alteribacter populi]|uniref:hypothetical protein n=1 Tax=Alteribacter populi TaxID=2011011 RepID=UPI000BBAC467|nr:hypothetical protein [Alteribacter populi]
MAPFFLRCFFITTVFFFGFIFGIVYVNHLSGAFEFSTEESSPLQIPQLGSPDQNIVEIEDGDHLVIYGEDDEEIKKELLTSADVQRDLAEKQTEATETGTSNLFSQVGMRLADTFEAIFKGIYSGLG